MPTRFRSASRTRLFSSASGTRFLSATLGQTIYFDTPRVTLPDEVATDRQFSDLIAQMELQAFKNWNVDMGVQWDHEHARAEKSEIRLQYRPARQQVVNLGYRFQRDRLEQADFSLAWPISVHWRLYGRTLYSLRDKQAIEHFAGFEYSSCCWRVRAVARDTSAAAPASATAASTCSWNSRAFPVSDWLRMLSWSARFADTLPRESPLT